MEQQFWWGPPYRFNAKELDEETGLYYYGARYYDPRVSMWWGVDPLAGEMPAWSSYTYTFQNPVRYIDPTGMFPEEGGDPPGSNLPVVFVTATRPEKKQDGPINGISQAFGAIPELANTYAKNFPSTNILAAFQPNKIPRSADFGVENQRARGGVESFGEDGRGGENRHSAQSKIGSDIGLLIGSFDAAKATANPLKNLPFVLQYGVDMVKTTGTFITIENPEAILESTRSRIAVDSTCLYCPGKPHGLRFQTLDIYGIPIDTLFPHRKLKK